MTQALGWRRPATLPRRTASSPAKIVLGVARHPHRPGGDLRKAHDSQPLQAPAGFRGRLVIARCGERLDFWRIRRLGGHSSHILHQAGPGL